MQVPDRFLRAVARGASSLLPVATPSGSPSCPGGPAWTRRSRASRRSAHRRGSRCWAGATSRSIRAPIGATARDVMPHVPPALRRRCQRGERCGHRARPARLRGPQADRARGHHRGRSHRRSTSRRCRPGRWSTRACSPLRSWASSSPTCATSASRPPLALVHSPVLHQHVPVVAAGPPVPLPRPQRRDQHRAGQPELDARTRGADLLTVASRR